MFITIIHIIYNIHSKNKYLLNNLNVSFLFLAVSSRYKSLLDLTLLLFVAETTTLKISYIFPNGDKYGELADSFKCL